MTALLPGAQGGTRSLFLPEGLRIAICTQGPWAAVGTGQESTSHQIWAVHSEGKELTCDVDVTTGLKEEETAAQRGFANPLQSHKHS